MVALRPFSTLTLSILLGSISKKRLPVWLPYRNPPCVLVDPSKGTPSTTNNGCELPLIVDTPRMVMLVPDPEIPLLFKILTPGALPCNKRIGSPSGRSSNCFLSTEATAYPSAFFSRLIPSEVTTTSEIVSEEAASVTLDALEAATSVAANPTLEITSTVPPLGTLRVKLPLASVDVPFLRLFFCTTEAPTTGTPLSSRTLPVTAC